MLISTYLYEALGAAFVLLTLPLVLELAVLTLASRLPRRSGESSAVTAPIHLAVIIPAHNEEILIGSCIESLRVSIGGDPARIIAVAHNCSDRTAERAAEAGAEVLTYNDALARGKGCALAHGFAYASSQGVDASLVVDADSTVSPNLIRAVRKALGNGAEAVQCRYEMDSSSKRPSTRLTSLAFRGFNVVRPAGRDRLGLSAGILGNGFAVRQTVVANNSYKSLSVVEDLEFHIRLVLSGKKVHFLSDAKVSSALPSTKQGESTQRSRWEGGRANAARMWLVPLLKQLIRGRLCALEPALDLASLPIGYGAALLMVTMGLPLTWIRIYALIATLVIACHVLVAAWSGTDFAGDMRVLARAPGYILWKLFMVPSLLRSSRAESAWIRTEREPAIVLDATGEATQAKTVEHAVAIRTSLEIS
jgi:cellulose synthase/poly-beta-1,6-N-acetylglucosamine synthase-like glycosyltransferase